MGFWHDVGNAINDAANDAADKVVDVVTDGAQKADAEATAAVTDAIVHVFKASADIAGIAVEATKYAAHTAQNSAKPFVAAMGDQLAAEGDGIADVVAVLKTIPHTDESEATVKQTFSTGDIAAAIGKAADTILQIRDALDPLSGESDGKESGGQQGDNSNVDQASDTLLFVWSAKLHSADVSDIHDSLLQWGGADHPIPLADAGHAVDHIDMPVIEPPVIYTDHFAFNW